MKCNYRLVHNKSNKLNKAGKAVVYIEVSFKRDKRKFINTNVYITPENWSESKRQINHNKKNYIQLNLFLNEQINNIEKYELSLIEKKKSLTPSLLTEFLKGNSKLKESFFDFAFYELERDTILLATINKTKTNLNIIQKFKPDLTFAEIDYNYIYDLDNYLKKLPNVNSQNTIYTYHKSFKKFLNLAINKGLFPMENNPYIKFKVKLAKPNRENLTEQELNRIKEVTYKHNPFLQEILDMFIFSCYTGLRYSDMVSLKLKYFDIVDDSNVTLHLPEMQKTKDRVSLPLHLLFGGAALKIFNKYISSGSETHLFETIPNQVINRELKIIARYAGIKKNLSFHVARHTFGTLLANKTGDPYLIKDLMGHSDIKMSMEYIHRSEKVRNDKLSKVDR